MNKHKNQAKAQLEHLINRNSAAGCLLAKRPLLDCPLFGLQTNISVNSSHVHSNPLHNKIDDQTVLMLQHLKGYQNYYMRLMEAERRKFCEHFDQMFKILKEQCEIGLFHIDKSIDQLRDIFFRKQHSIKNAKNDLIRKQNIRRLKLQERLQSLSRQMSFQVVLLDVQLSDLTNFRADIRKYLVGPAQNIFAGCHEPELIELQAQQIAHQRPMKEMSTQTEAYPPAITESREEEMDDLLGCDEDMGLKLSTSARRRRKYQVGRRDIIKEEDQSSQSSIISES